MPLKYIAPEVRTCDYCGARTQIPKGLTRAETKRRVQAIGWTVYRDCLVLCPACARQARGERPTIADRTVGRIPGVRRFVR